MKKATDEIKNILKHIDIVIEVIDARATKASSNEDLYKIINNKINFKIALKDDLSEGHPLNSDILFGSLNDKSFRNKIINKLEHVIKDKKERLIKRGLKNPKFLVLVIGLPNVGKSSLINFLKQRNILGVRNLPGLTKKQQIVSINSNFDLIDTPGIFIKDILDIDTGFKLSLIHCIKKEVLPIENVLKYGFDYLNKYYQQALLEYYSINEYVSFYEFCELISRKYGFIEKNNEIDINRLYERLFNDISLSKITKIDFEK